MSLSCLLHLFTLQTALPGRYSIWYPLNRGPVESPFPPKGRSLVCSLFRLSLAPFSLGRCSPFAQGPKPQLSLIISSSHYPSHLLRSPRFSLFHLFFLSIFYLPSKSLAFTSFFVCFISQSLITFALPNTTRYLFCSASLHTGLI
jgi:hypothetical protein